MRGPQVESGETDGRGGARRHKSDQSNGLIASFSSLLPRTSCHVIKYGTSALTRVRTRCEKIQNCVRCKPRGDRANNIGVPRSDCGLT
jgi:hypothetical protein